MDVVIGLTGEVRTTKTGDEVVTEGVEEGVTEEETVGGVTTIAGTPGRERDAVDAEGLEEEGLKEEVLEEEVVVAVLEDLGLGSVLEDLGLGGFFLHFFFRTSFQSDSWSDSEPDGISEKDEKKTRLAIQAVLDQACNES